MVFSMLCDYIDYIVFVSLHFKQLSWLNIPVNCNCVSLNLWLFSKNKEDNIYLYQGCH